MRRAKKEFCSVLFFDAVKVAVVEGMAVGDNQ
jgi:hypothetical protein